MTDPITRFEEGYGDRGDEKYEADKDARLDKLRKLSWTQIEAAVEVAEARYDEALGWRAKVAAQKMMEETSDPAAWKAARETVQACEELAMARMNRTMKADRVWAEVRGKP